MHTVISAALFIGWNLGVIGFDCRRRRVPNWLVLAGFGLAWGMVLDSRSPFHLVLADAALGMIAGLFVQMPFYCAGMMGAADVKVFAIIGAFCGVHALPAIWIGASLAAGIHALWMIAASMAVFRSQRERDEPAVGVSAGTSHAVTLRAPLNRGTPYAALLGIAALASFILHFVEVAR